MPVANIRGVDLHYELLGERGPFVALQPGGRRAGVSLKPLAEKIAEAGHRVLIYDRRNCGASGIAIEGESENDEWAEDLHELLGHLDAAPAFVGGSSSGCRLALILAQHHPGDVRGLLLWRVTGGAHAAEHLSNQYYTSHIEAARKGGMAAVCGLDHWKEVIAANAARRDVLMALDPQDFIARMTRWRKSFDDGAEHAVIGLSAAQLGAMAMPACVVPGKDPVHPLAAGQAAHRLIPNAEYVEVVTEQAATLDEAFADWAEKDGLLAATYIDFMRPHRR